METLIIKTGEKTINAKVKTLISANIKGIAFIKKLHVPGLGYVWYFSNKFGVALGNVLIDGGQAVIRLKGEFEHFSA